MGSSLWQWRSAKRRPWRALNGSASQEVPDGVIARRIGLTMSGSLGAGRARGREAHRFDAMALALAHHDVGRLAGGGDVVAQVGQVDGGPDQAGETAGR